MTLKRKRFSLGVCGCVQRNYICWFGKICVYLEIYSKGIKKKIKYLKADFSKKRKLNRSIKPIAAFYNILF